MAVMLKLRLPPELQNFQAVQKLSGLSDLSMDERFGLVSVDPKEGMFVVLVREVDRLAERKKLCPALIEAYGDQRIEPITKKENRKEERDD